VPTDVERRYMEAQLAARYPLAAPPREAPSDEKKEKNTEAMVALPMDALAGALKGTVAATLGLPGDIESLIRLLTGGEQKLPTTEDIQQALPAATTEGMSDERKAVTQTAATLGEFLPAGPIAAAAKVAGVKRTAKAAGAAAAATPAATGDR
jgi:hypothetical protein